MTLWNSIKELVDNVTGEDKPEPSLGEDEVRVAAAASSAAPARGGSTR